MIRLIGITSVAHGNHIKIQLPNAKTLDEVVIQGLPKRRKQAWKTTVPSESPEGLKGGGLCFKHGFTFRARAKIGAKLFRLKREKSNRQHRMNF
jgi:hypothetical protein